MSNRPETILFYVNGPARLLMAAIIKDEFYPEAQATLVLLDQYKYKYDQLLPFVEKQFDQIVVLKIPVPKNTIFTDFSFTYLQRHRNLQNLVDQSDRTILFDLRSPVQKTLARYSVAAGHPVDVYAESIAVSRTLDQPLRDRIDIGLYRRLFPKAYGIPHVYDRFFVHVPEAFSGSPWASKIERMTPLLTLPAGQKYVDLILRDVDLSLYQGFDTVFFGQPLSNFDGMMSQAEEEALLLKILGDRRVLILPHPGEQLGENNKYRVLNALVMPQGLPNTLIIEKLRPKTTLTYSSTIGLEYAVIHPETSSQFYPVTAPSLALLHRYQPHVPGMKVHSDFCKPHRH